MMLTRATFQVVEVEAFEGQVFVDLDLYRHRDKFL